MSFFSLFKRAPKRSHEERLQEATRFLEQRLELAYLQGGIDTMRQINEKQHGTFESFLKETAKHNEASAQIIYQIVADIWGKE